MTGQFPPAPPPTDRNDSHDPAAAWARIAELRAVLEAAKARGASNLHDHQEGTP